MAYIECRDLCPYVVELDGFATLNANAGAFNGDSIFRLRSSPVAQTSRQALEI